MEIYESAYCKTIISVFIQCIVSIIVRQITVRHFPDRHFLVRHFPDLQFPARPRFLVVPHFSVLQIPVTHFIVTLITV